MKYKDFLQSKLFIAPAKGFKPIKPINPSLFEFQRVIVEWAIRKGRAAIFADCGVVATMLTFNHENQERKDNYFMRSVRNRISKISMSDGKRSRPILLKSLSSQIQTAWKYSALSSMRLGILSAIRRAKRIEATILLQGLLLELANYKKKITNLFKDRTSSHSPHSCRGLLRQTSLIWRGCAPCRWKQTQQPSYKLGRVSQSIPTYEMPWWRNVEKRASNLLFSQRLAAERNNMPLFNVETQSEEAFAYE